MTATQLVLAGKPIETERARRVIAGYCFHEVPSVIKPPDLSYGPPVEPWTRARWGYRTYDCQTGGDLGIVDLVAPVLLNVTQGYGVRLIADLLAVAPRVRTIVQEVSDGFCFWDLDRRHVTPEGEPPEGSDSRRMHRAWEVVESVEGAGVAVTHKLLHHAWPHLFPLIDNETIVALARDHAWLTILDDLQRHERVWVELEDWFAALAAEQGGVSLTRLRLYDILLWCRVVGEEQQAAEAGAEIVG